eukprot:SAG11_NODE_25166_length_362_cov_5.403042_1_plen_77_part_10
MLGRSAISARGPPSVNALVPDVDALVPDRLGERRYYITIILVVLSLRLPSTYFGDLEAGFVPNKDFISRKMHVFGRL